MTQSYSQYGEDRIIAAQFPEGFVGRMMEIGSWDPIDKSNSRLFIERGWSALLIEPTPIALEKLCREYGSNPNVHVLGAAVVGSENYDEKLHLRVTADAVSTSSDEVYRTWRAVGGYYADLDVLSTDWLRLRRMYGYNWDFVSIDAEGCSLGIFRDVMATLIHVPKGHETACLPRVICVEFDDQPEVVRQLAAANGYSVIMDSNVNGTNMVLKKINDLPSKSE